MLASVLLLAEFQKLIGQFLCIVIGCNDSLVVVDNPVAMF